MKIRLSDIDLRAVELKILHTPKSRWPAILEIVNRPKTLSEVVKEVVEDLRVKNGN